MKSFWKHFFLDNGDISLIEAGYQKFEANQVNSYTVKHDLVFHIVLDGRGYYRVNDRTYDLGRDDGFILKKNQTVYYVPDEDQPWTTCWIGMGGKNLAAYLKNTLVLAEDVVRFEEDSSVKSAMLTYLKFLAQSNPANRLDYIHIFSWLYHLLHQINAEFAVKAEVNDSYSMMDSSLAEKIYQYISRVFMQDVTVKEIADHFAISRNYLFKICKEYYKQSPKQMIQELRMNRASQLLRGTQLQVKEIAALTGYKDSHGFSRMFKLYYHYSPLEFRGLDEGEIDKALFIRGKFL